MMPGLKFLLTDSPAKICLIEPQPGLSGLYLQDGQTKNSDGLLASLLSNWHLLGYSLYLREITLRSERERESERARERHVGVEELRKNYFSDANVQHRQPVEPNSFFSLQGFKQDSQKSSPQSINNGPPTGKVVVEESIVSPHLSASGPSIIELIRYSLQPNRLQRHLLPSLARCPRPHRPRIFFCGQ